MSKKKKVIVNKKIVITIIAIIVIIYAIYRIYCLIKKPTDTFLVETGNLSSEQSVQGYVIRDEQVIKGENYKNGMEKIKTEGEKVSVGEAIFRYYTSGEEELVKKIEELDIKIADALEKEESSIIPTDIKALDNKIEEKINSVYKLNNLQKIKEYKSDINNYITKKAKIAGEYSPAGSYLKELISQRSNYENQLNNGSEYITATRAGIVSYRVDGLEEVLTPTNFGTLSKKTLEGLKLKTGEIVSTSEESGKIINNFECYIACILDSEKIEEVKIGDSLKIRLSNNKETSVEIEYISEESEDESLIVFKLDKYVEELINYRKISFDIIWWSANGLKVPNEAIKKESEDLNYVVRTRNGYTDKIYIKVLKQNENYTIIDNYNMTELKEKGIQQSTSISIYDEIML